VHDANVNEDGFDRWGMLVSAAQRGDEVAYETFLVELQAWLPRYYRHRCRSSAIDDAVQEALLAVHAKKQTYDRARPFGPWLTAIVRYKWIDWVRTLKRESALPLAPRRRTARTSRFSSCPTSGSSSPTVAASA